METEIPGVPSRINGNDPQKSNGNSARLGRTDDKMLIFLSYKKEERELADKLKLALETQAPGRLKVYVSGYDEIGDQWRRLIKEKLQQADWLILLYTDKEHDWGWCLFESGYFDGSRPECQNKKLVVLHARETQRPKPLDEFQGIPIGEPDGQLRSREEISVGAFLRKLYCEPFRTDVEPLNEGLGKDADAMRALETRVSEIIGKSLVESREHTNHLTISIPPPLGGGTPDSIPDQTMVRGALYLFGLIEIEKAPWSVVWRAICERCAPPDAERWQTNWLKRIEFVISMLLQGKHGIDPVLPLLHDRTDKKTYRPILQRHRRYSSGRLEIVLQLSRVSRVTSRSTAGEAITRVLDLLELGRMLRWGAVLPVLRNVRSHKKSLLGKELEHRRKVLELLYRDLDDTIQLHILPELQARGYERDSSLEAMATLSQKERLERLFTEWGECFGEEKKQKKLLHAMVKRGDVNESLRLLEKLDSLTVRWLDLCAERVSELIAAESRPRAEAPPSKEHTRQNQT